MGGQRRGCVTATPELPAQSVKAITDAQFKLRFSWEAGMDVRNRPSRAFVLGMLWILALVVTACESTTDPADEERRLGLIILPPDSLRVVLPNTVQAGVEFVVEVTTYGSICDRKGETEVAKSGNRVVITPYDYVRLCGPDAQALFVHQATVEFSEPGLASVVIQGFSSSIPEDDEVVEIERDVMVLVP